MKFMRQVRWAMLLGSGAIMLQGTGCTFQNGLEVLQTIFLGVTAAGGYALLQNV